MNCAKAQSLMLDHLYGDLKPSSERALLRHLQECSACSEEFETHKATAASFAKLDMEEPFFKGALDFENAGIFGYSKGKIASIVKIFLIQLIIFCQRWASFFSNLME